MQTGTPQKPLYSQNAKPVPLRLILLRTFGAIVLAGLMITGESLFAWLSVPVLFVVWGTDFVAHQIYLRHLRALPRFESVNDPEDPDALPGVTVISPARNEEQEIEGAARSLAQLEYPDLEIILVNDHSTDSTPEIMNRLQTEFSHLHVVHDPPVQEGWLGKANAVWQAIQQADPAKKWLLLTDADVVFEPQALRKAVACAEEQGYDFLTAVTFLNSKTLAEQLILTPKWCSTLAAANPDKLNIENGPTIGLGAFTLVKRQVYLDCGGHAAFPGEQPEDTLLARVVKQAGGKMGVAWTTDLIRIRMYSGYRQIMEYTVRKNRMLLDDSLRSMYARALYWVLIMVLPLPVGVASVAHMAHDGFSFGLAICAVLALSSYYIGVSSYRSARYVARISPFVPLLHPIGYWLKTWIEIKGAFQVLRGKEMTWRGRAFENIRTSAKTTEESD